LKPLELRAARIALGMNQRELAEALLLSGEATIRSWESGRRPISGPAQVAIRLMLKHGETK
jgi:DNA-binding transcriptional regulator YiaG